MNIYDDDGDQLSEHQNVVHGEVWCTKTITDPVFLCEVDDCENCADVRISKDNGDGISTLYLCDECLAAITAMESIKQ